MNGQLFTVHKFRSMRRRRRSHHRRGLGAAERPRVTPIGRFLRRTRLDELPQLWNVLIGDMSFVGPRPERPEFVERADRSRSRSTASATSSGRASPAGRRSATPTAPASRTRCEKLQYDLFYIKHLSIALDLFIILETIKTVVLRRGADVSAQTGQPHRQRDDHRRRGLLPRQRVRRRRAARATGTQLESRVVRQHRIGCSTMFDDAGVRGTFFVLGWVAERFPALVRRIAARGPRGRVARLRASAGLRSDAAAIPRRRAPRQGAARGRQPAPRCAAIARRAIRSRTRSLWALDVLIEEGYDYDASIFPIRHDRYGIPMRRAIRIVLDARSRLADGGAALDRAARPALNLPIAGGGYFRLLPYGWTRWGIGRVNRVEHRPVIFYLHPWEIDPDQPRLPSSGLSRVPALPQSARDRGAAGAAAARFPFRAARGPVARGPAAGRGTRRLRSLRRSSLMVDQASLRSRRRASTSSCRSTRRRCSSSSSIPRKSSSGKRRSNAARPADGDAAHRPGERSSSYGIKPTYVIDYPVAHQPAGYGPLLDYVASRSVHHWRAPASLGHPAARRDGERA